jgi:RNA polymerase-binding transcription factor DksA
MNTKMKKKPAKKAKPVKKAESKPVKPAAAGKFPCTICGEPIPAIRREVFPHIDYCVKCSDKHHLTPTILPDDVCDPADTDTDFR